MPFCPVMIEMSVGKKEFERKANTQVLSSIQFSKNIIQNNKFIVFFFKKLEFFIIFLYNKILLT